MSLSVVVSLRAPLAAPGAKPGRQARAHRSRAMRCVAAAAASETSEQRKTLKKNADVIADDLKGVSITFVGVLLQRLSLLGRLRGGGGDDAPHRT